MEALVFGTFLFDWWSQTSADPGATQFLLKFSNGKWEIPWEWLFGRLKFTERAKTVSIARLLDNTTPVWAPSEFTERLRTLILHGDDGTRYGAKLDLAAESREIDGAWSDLELELRDRIDRPVVRRADSVGAIRQHLKDVTPHLVWFSGHGSEKGVLLKDGMWLDGRGLGAAISAAGSRPHYAVLMACDTARKLPRHLQPTVIEGLMDAGLLGVIAMQAPIGDLSSRILAREVFSGIGTGFSLEIALARARYALKEKIAGGRNGVDWAAPVYWSSASPVSHWTWRVGDNRIVSLQVVGRESAHLDVFEAGAVDGIPDADRPLVQLCLDNPRVWLFANDDPELQTRWISLMMALQRQAPRALLAIEFSEQDPATALSLWAEKLHARLLPGDCPDDVAELIAQISRSRLPSAYWQRLCALADIGLAIGNPPRPEDASWFWDPLVRRSSVLVRAAWELPDEWLTDWSVDRIVPLLQTNQVSRAIEQAPRLVRALAVLRQPLGFAWMKLVSPDALGASSLADWPEWRSHLIELKRGPIMPASTRQAVLAASSDADRRTAHSDCAQMLYATRLENYEVREEIIFHLAAASDDAVVPEAAGLARWYRSEDRPRAIAALVARLGAQAQDVPADVRLCFAWAYLQLGDTPVADFWLRRAEPVHPLDCAWKNGLNAEIRKAQGDRDGALEQIEAAIAECRKALDQNTDRREPLIRALRNHEQDRARIIHFLFYDREAAAAEYQRLLDEWQDVRDAAYDVAIVQRNYAECLRTLAVNHDDERWLRAKDRLISAEQIAREFPYSTLLAEVLYEQYRVADAEQSATAAERLEECQAAARQSGHDMMLAIAYAQSFWRSVPHTFPLAEWEAIGEALSVFGRHGWSVRTLLNGRIRAAVRLQADRPNDAVAQLGRNQEDIAMHPAFNRGTDRVRIAATAAGLDVLGHRVGRTTTPWQAFLDQTDWAAEFIASEGLASAEDAWQTLSARL